jgi:light-regulated signal transduction histidine kinase (bacteriophytochrome)
MRISPLAFLLICVLAGFGITVFRLQQITRFGQVDGDLETRIFGRFYRADKARSRTEGHTGPRLAISKAIVRTGGSIEVGSAAGAGATFTVRLPVR